MSQQPPPEPRQELNVDDASIQDSQVGQAGGNLIQIQAGFVNVSIDSEFSVPGWPNKQLSSTAKSLTQQEYRQRKVLLNKVKKFWVEGVLKNSLHNQVLIELGLEERNKAVQSPFKGVEEFPKEREQSLLIPNGINAADLFEQMGEGRTLLILGEPGSGKTVTLLKLAQSFIEQTEQDLSQNIPVVFNLSSWANTQQTISNWLTEELSSKYSVSKSPKMLNVKKST